MLLVEPRWAPEAVYTLRRRDTSVASAWNRCPARSIVAWSLHLLSELSRAPFRFGILVKITFYIVMGSQLFVAYVP
jgi:hypothetical protein